MATDIMLTPDAAMRTALSGIPPVNFPENLWASVAAGRRHTAILREVIALRRGPGKLTPNEYFIYRLWGPVRIPVIVNTQST
jgi:hypothetical protein